MTSRRSSRPRRRGRSASVTCRCSARVELAIGHGMPMTIRVMLHFYGDQPRDRLHHVYLEGARTLRDDLPD